MLDAEFKKLLEDNEFLTLATSNPDGIPNAAPMFLIKVEDEYLYVIDYTIGTTFRNLNVNPQVSVCVADVERLYGLKVCGPVEILKEGEEFDQIAEELKKKTLSLTVKRVLEGIKKKKAHQNFEIGMPDVYVVYKIKVREVVLIGPKGRIERMNK